MKFSELTLDKFRMLQTLECEPTEDLSNQLFDASPAPGRMPFVSVPNSLLIQAQNSGSICFPSVTSIFCSDKLSMGYSTAQNFWSLGGASVT